MQALFIGHTYIDVTLLCDRVPTGDEKTVAQDYAVSFGGNAVTAAFACAKLGIVPDLMATLADDWLGRMFLDMAAAYQIPVHPRRVSRSSLSFVLPNDGKRAIIRARDADYLEPFPILDLYGCRALHLDGHLADAAVYYARACREKGILTSLDGGGRHGDIEDLLNFIDVAIVAERLCEQLRLTPAQMLDFLKAKGCRIGGVTHGERGMLWYDETGSVALMPALSIPMRTLSTPLALAMCSTAPIWPLISPRRSVPLWPISNSLGPRPPTKSKISAMRPGCPHWPISRRSTAANSRRIRSCQKSHENDMKLVLAETSARLSTELCE